MRAKIGRNRAASSSQVGASAALMCASGAASMGIGAGSEDAAIAGAGCETRALASGRVTEREGSGATTGGPSCDCRCIGTSPGGVEPHPRQEDVVVRGIEEQPVEPPRRRDQVVILLEGHV